MADQGAAPLMPAVEVYDLRQAAVLWPALTDPPTMDNYGEIQVGAPIEIRVIWDDQATQSMDRQGNTIALDGTVVASRDIDNGSWMWLGSLDDLEAMDGGLIQLMSTKKFNKATDIKNRHTARDIGLMKYKELSTADITDVGQWETGGEIWGEGNATWGLS